MFNFKRRDSCFKCYASREESERGGEGSDEISNILTKSINIENILKFIKKKIQLQNSFINKPSFEISNLNFAYMYSIIIVNNTKNANNEMNLPNSTSTMQKSCYAIWMC